MTRYNAYVLASIAGTASAAGAVCNSALYANSSVWYTEMLRAVTEKTGSNFANKIDVVIALNERSDTLMAELNKSESACGDALFTFAKEAYTALGAVTTCDKTNSWDAADVARLQSYACVSLLETSIDKFNAAAKNGFDIRTGKLLTQCTLQEFLDIDAPFAAYKSMMNNALHGEALPDGFEDAYTKVACRPCFIDFVKTIKDAEDDGSGNVLSSGNCSNLYTGGTCKGNSIVEKAIKDFQVCIGTENVLNVDETHHCTDDEKLLYETSFRSFEAVAECGSGTYDNDCLASRRPALVGLNSADTSCKQCYSNFAASAKDNDKCDDAFAASCSGQPGGIVRLGSVHEINFYKCAGFRMNMASTVCDSKAIAKISDIHKSFIPLVENALVRTSPASAAAYTFALKDLMDEVKDLACVSCYAALAAELQIAFADKDNVSLCIDPYTAGCKNAIAIDAALARFKTCAGFALTNESASACSVAEYDVLRSANVPEKSYDLILSGSTVTVVEALFKFGVIMDDVRAAHPTMAFRCEHCFNNLLNDLYQLDNATKNLCKAKVNMSECFIEISDIMNEFRSCSGFLFDFSVSATSTVAPVTTTAGAGNTATEGTTVAAGTTATTTSATETKASSMSTPVAIVAMFMMALVL